MHNKAKLIQVISVTMLSSLVGLVTPAVAQAVDPEEESGVRPPSSTNNVCADIRCLRVVGDVSDGPVEMQARPRAWAQVVGTIPGAARNVIPLGETAVSASIEWIHVEYNGIRGWVPAQFLAQ